MRFERATAGGAGQRRARDDELHVLSVFIGPDASRWQPARRLPRRRKQSPRRRLAWPADLKNFSETVFVDDPAEGAIRIFTPARELPFGRAIRQWGTGVAVRGNRGARTDASGPRPARFDPRHGRRARTYICARQPGGGPRLRAAASSSRRGESRRYAVRG